MNKKILISAFLLLLCSCSSTKHPLIRYKKQHQDYLNQVKEFKRSHSADEYKKFLEKQLEIKETKLANLEAISGSVEKHHSNYESRQDPTQQDDVFRFKTESAELRLRQIDERKKLIERELFFLKSQLSSLK